MQVKVKGMTTVKPILMSTRVMMLVGVMKWTILRFKVRRVMKSTVTMTVVTMMKRQTGVTKVVLLQ